MFDAAHPETLDVLARTLWAEARNQSRAGMEAVASVILNRAAHPRWWGRSVLDVCLKPRQFSCWNADDPQFSRIRSVGSDEPLFRLALAVAAQALNGHLDDATNGADSYANLAVCSPVWAERIKPCAVIGAHTFFRVELPPPPPKAAVAHVVLGAAPPDVPEIPARYPEQAPISGTSKPAGLAALFAFILSLFRKGPV